MVASDFPEVDLVASPTNLGFAAATNLGARRGDSPFVLALNPDTAVTAGALDTVLATMEAHPEAAIVGPRLLRRDGSLDHASKRSFPTPLSALGHFSGIGRRPGASGRLADYRAPEVESGPVDSVNGAFMLIRRDAFEAAGGFDEGYWMYMEDLDLSYRLARAGLDQLVRAGRRGRARQGRDHGRRALTAPGLGLPSRHVPLLPKALRRRALRGPSTSWSTPGSPSGWRGPSPHRCSGPWAGSERADPGDHRDRGEREDSQIAPDRDVLDVVELDREPLIEGELTRVRAPASAR